MRISDWSSDVCSSDLQNPGVALGSGSIANQNINSGSALNLRGLGPDATLTLLNGRRLSYSGFVNAVDVSVVPIAALDRIEVIADGASAIYGSDRSEEHTSELQSLMRISYAVFCLQKQKTT